MTHSLLDSENLNFKGFSGYIDEAARRIRRGNSAKNMYEGDMWDRGRGYIGPIPVENDQHHSDILYNIKRTFTGRNVIAEVVDRQVDALLSKSPDWKIYEKSQLFTSGSAQTNEMPLSEDPVENQTRGDMQVPTETINPKIKEAETLLSEIWNRAKLGDALKASITERMVTGRGVLRLYLSKKFFDKQENIKDLVDVIKYIKVECPSNEKAVVLDDGGDKLSIVELTNKKDKVKQLEISFVDENDKTFVATIDSSSTISTENLVEEDDEDDVQGVLDKVRALAELSSPMNLQGEITVDEIEGKPFITDTMLQNNRALNLDLSLGVGILVESGYAEMVMTNVSMATRSAPDPEDPSKTIQVPVGLKRGPGVVNNLIGEQSVTSEGDVKFEQPDVYFKEPSPLKTFIDGENLFYRQILAEAKQEHVLITGDAKASGESRIQARQDFVKKSQRYKPSLDVHISWLLNTIMNIAASAIGKDGYFEELGVLADSKIYAGELSADEQNVLISRYEKGLISRETAITLLGSEEPLLEISKIKVDEADKLAKQVKSLEATSKFGNMIANGAPSTTGQQARPNTVAGSAGSQAGA